MSMTAFGLKDSWVSSLWVTPARTRLCVSNATIELSDLGATEITEDGDRLAPALHGSLHATEQAE